MNLIQFRIRSNATNTTFVRRLARLQSVSAMMASCSPKQFVAATTPIMWIAQKGLNYNQHNPLAIPSVKGWMVSTHFLPGIHVQNSTIVWRVKLTKSHVRKESSLILQKEPAFILICQPVSTVQLTLFSTSSAQIWTNASLDSALVITIDLLIPLIVENSSSVLLMVNHVLADVHLAKFSIRRTDSVMSRRKSLNVRTTTPSTWKMENSITQKNKIQRKMNN